MKNVKPVHICLALFILLTIYVAAGCDTNGMPVEYHNSPIPEPTGTEFPVETMSPVKFGLYGDLMITIGTDSDYEDAGVYCLCGDADFSSDVVTSTNLDISTPGVYTVHYVFRLNNDWYRLNRKIKVIDTTPPVLHLSGDEDMIVYTNELFMEPGFSAHDNCDGNITDRVEIKDEHISKTEFRRIYTVKDSAGNECSKERIIKFTEPENKDLIYLTFDDGPHKDITPHVLDILKKYNVKATFFLVNFDDSLIPLVNRIVEEGHSVAIHGYDHDYNVIYTSEEAYLNNLYLMQQRIRDVTGLTTYITRFPYGSYNTIASFNPGIMARLRERVPAEGYKYFDWNVSSGDGVLTTTPEAIFNYVTKGLKRGRSNIVLMHDSWGRGNTVAALPQVIEYGLANGYCFGVISEHTPPL